MRSDRAKALVLIVMVSAGVGAGVVIGRGSRPATSTAVVTVEVPVDVGRAVSIPAPARALGATGPHGPKGEPCVHVYKIPGANDHVLRTSTTTVKKVIYTTTIFGTWHYRPGTKAPPAYPPIKTETVCAYTPR